MVINNPLSSTELKELHDFLFSGGTPKRCMNLSNLDGFLAAEVIGPTQLVPDRLLPFVFGETDRERMVWDSAEQAQHYLDLIERHLNHIRYQVRNVPNKYKPYLFKREEDSQPMLMVWRWCYGFMLRVKIDGPAWAPMFDSEKVFEQYLTIRNVVTGRSDKELALEPDFQKKIAKVARSLPRCVEGIMKYWDLQHSRFPPKPRHHEGSALFTLR